MREISFQNCDKVQAAIFKWRSLFKIAKLRSCPSLPTVVTSWRNTRFLTPIFSTVVPSRQSPQSLAQLLYNFHWMIFCFTSSLLLFINRLQSFPSSWAFTAIEGKNNLKYPYPPFSFLILFCVYQKFYTFLKFIRL